jgi:hypothetical protein
MQTIDEQVRDLLDRYRHPEDDDPAVKAGPGLLARLDDLALRTAQPRQAGGHAPPASRPPGSLDAVHWSVRIKTEAIVLDQQLRGSNYPQSWDKALRAIPPNAQAADRLAIATRTVGMWHSTCLTVLGLQTPAIHMSGVICLACGDRTIKVRADRDQPRAWCSNEDCVDEATGRPARYEGARLYLLTRSVEA